MADSTASESQSLKFQLLSATYQSPTNEAFTHTQQLPAPSTTKPTHRIAYLGALRKATAKLQEQINKDLTSRMEEDKTREASTSTKVNGKGVDESKEEDNYGEEVPEED